MGISGIDCNHISSDFYDKQETNIITGNKSAAFLSNKKPSHLSILKKAGTMSPPNENIKKLYSPIFILEFIMDIRRDRILTTTSSRVLSLTFMAELLEERTQLLKSVIVKSLEILTSILKLDFRFHSSAGRMLHKRMMETAFLSEKNYQVSQPKCLVCLWDD